MVCSDGSFHPNMSQVFQCFKSPHDPIILDRIVRDIPPQQAGASLVDATHGLCPILYELSRVFLSHSVQKDSRI